ncbi:MAG: DsbA family protein [Propionibacteriaceae bacterium]|nr:DsbA family protein [Propionibacteriaceae bacterium]
MANSSQVRRSRREQLEAKRIAAAKKERRNRILFAVTGVLILALVIAIAVWGIMAATNNKGGSSLPPNVGPKKVGIYLSPPVDGAKTLEIFSNYTCPRCRSAHLTLGAVLEQAMNEGKVNVLYYSISYGSEESYNAAVAAACSDFQGVYPAFNSQLYLQQPEGFEETVLLETIPDLVGLTGDALEQYQTCYTNKDTGAFVDSVTSYSSKQGIGGTPTFLLDGVDIGEQIWNPATSTYDPDLLRELLGM